MQRSCPSCGSGSRCCRPRIRCRTPRRCGPSGRSSEQNRSFANPPPKGALFFAAFSTFWTTLAFLLGTPHYHLGPGTAGSFGILGATGALIAPIAGKMNDRRGSRFVINIALVVMILGFVVLWIFGYHLLGLVAGVIVLDFGAQGEPDLEPDAHFRAAAGGAQPREYHLHDIVFSGRLDRVGTFHLGLGAVALEWRLHSGRGISAVGPASACDGSSLARDAGSRQVVETIAEEA